MPLCWQGWLWAMAWLAAIVLPFWLLVSSERIPESLVWLAVIVGFWVWEVRQLRAHGGCMGGGEDVLYIGDEAENERLATRNYDFRLRP